MLILSSIVYCSSSQDTSALRTTKGDDSDDDFDGYLDMDEEQRNEGESGRGAT